MHYSFLDFRVKLKNMEANSLPVCRLCLQTNAGSVNIWQTFQDSLIASILAKHFWFQPHKDDEISEWLCQSCWSQTETFHHFYKRLECIHEQWNCKRLNDWFVGGSGAIKEEPEPIGMTMVTTVLDVNLKSVKSEEGPLSTEDTIDRSENGSNSSDECNDDNNVAGSRISTDDDGDETWNPTEESNDDEEEKPPTRTKADRQSKIDKEDALIREIFQMKCDICTDVDMSFEKLSEVRKHYRGVHKTDGYLVCCDVKFSNRYLIMEHVMRHVNPEANRCDQCDRICANKYALKSHVDAVHGTRDSRTFKCDLCPSSFVRSGALRAHVMYRHSESGEQFPCDECGKSFGTKLKLKSHQRLIHSSLPDHVCEICAKRCRTKGALKRHILNQHSTAPHPKIQCSVCGTRLKPECLKRHMQSMHDESFKAVICNLCGKSVKNKFALPNHLRHVHGGRRHQCVQCERAFKTSIQLKEHVACHSGESLYNCPYCDQKFKANANFFAHRRKKHMAEYMRDRATSAKLSALQKASTSGDDVKN